MPRNPPEEETAPQLLALALELLNLHRALNYQKHGVALQSILGFVKRTYSKRSRLLQVTWRCLHCSSFLPSYKLTPKTELQWRIDVYCTTKKQSPESP